MFVLNGATIDFTHGGNVSFQLLDFTSANGTFSVNDAFRLAKSDTPRNSDPFVFTKLYANRITGSLNLTIDLTNIAVLPGCSTTILAPKGFFIYLEYEDDAENGVVVFRKASTNGYTGCYNLSTNEYKLGLNYLPLTLLGEVGSAPTPSNRLLEVLTISGDEPKNTYIVIWGD
jgi:hypothetical protein